MTYLPNAIQYMQQKLKIFCALGLNVVDPDYTDENFIKDYHAKESFDLNSDA